MEVDEKVVFVVAGIDGQGYGDGVEHCQSSLVQVLDISFAEQLLFLLLQLEHRSRW